MLKITAVNFKFGYSSFNKSIHNTKAGRLPQMSRLLYIITQINLSFPF